MIYKRHKLGRLSETYAKHYLISNGYNILETNYLVPRYGEIDIIASKGISIEFVEVRSRSSGLSNGINQQRSFGKSVESIDNNKINSIQKAISHYLKYHGSYYRDYEKKISVIAIDLNYFIYE